MASSYSAIPRFLLPQSGRIWQRANLGNKLRSSDLSAVRYASGVSRDAKGKPIVLEKPERFNPPSHGARLPRKTRPQQHQHYGGSLSPEDIAAQKRKEYPGLPAPEGTWGHWFWHSRAIHLSITMGTLASLAIFTIVENFKRTTPFADMLPSGSDYREQPLESMRTLYEVWHLTQLHNSTIVAEKRKKSVDDVAKRAEYRKAHGLEQSGGLGNWTTKGNGEVLQPESGKREKWFGIF
ncbi:hypothetical protein VP1G_06009 [Cytospora mali]|uniref:Uncharacterized protein n=1 Tax=Cytospora mali TaxID=578113 RepID=A0A194V447_CYTMA|nr:hypothetical protein VP1G_06009 [Valsa mali var. pyri (nom. inval.)]